MKRTRQEALATRDRILDCAEVAFSTKGVSHTALEDIAVAAGVTRGAIYGHFRNKVEVFDAMVARVRLPLEAVMDTIVDPGAEDPLGRMRELLVRCLREAATDHRTHQVLDVLFTKCEYSSQMGGLLERVMQSNQEGRARLARGLTNAVRRGQLPADLDARRGAAVLHATLGGLLRAWLMDEASMSLPRDAARLADILIDMLRFSPALRRRRRVTGEAAAPSA